MAYLLPLVFLHKDLGFLTVNKGESSKLYLEPRLGNLLIVFPSSPEEGKSINDTMRELPVESVTYLTNILLQNTDLAVIISSKPKHSVSTFVAVSNAGVERFVKYRHDSASFHSYRASDISRQLLLENGYTERDPKYKNGNYFINRGIWMPLDQ